MSQRCDGVSHHQRGAADEAQGFGRFVQYALEMGAADPATSSRPPFNPVVTSDGGVQLEPPVAFVVGQLLKERKLVGAARAVQQRQL